MRIHRKHGPRQSRRALPLILLAVLLVGAGLPDRAGNATRPVAAVAPGKNGLLAVMRRDGNELHIFTLTAKGKKARPVTDGNWDTNPRWSPDGTRILFRSQNYDLWTVPAGGGTPTNLTNSIASLEVQGAWSPDGTAIAYISGHEVWTMGDDGSNQQPLFAGGLGSAFVDWSPDGSKLAVQVYEGGDYQVWVVDADGQNPTSLTSNSGSSQAPRWSHDGTRIVFDRGGDIWSMRADGSDQRNLTDTPAQEEIGPTYSPNGKRILFEVSDSDGRCQGLATVPAGGGTAKAVPKTAGTCYANPDWQAKPKKGKGKARPAAAQPNRAVKADGHRAKPAGHRRAAR